MAHIFRRSFSSVSKTKPASASDAAAEILDRFKDKLISVREQVLDPNQVQQLSLMLGRSNLHNGLSIEHKAPPIGSPIPPGYHLVYFTPSFLEKDLGLDGTDRSANPLTPFTRRMWAGGELKWNANPSRLLRVGQTVVETTRILSAEAKRTKAGHEMIVVGVEKPFENKEGIALIDKRNWVFQPEISHSKPIATPIAALPLPTRNIPGVHTKDITQTEVSLFRFSALTFNAHKIHYSKEWCREVEGHRDLVVHGPLNLINMLDLWRDSLAEDNPEAVPDQVAYRAMSPLYVNESYRIILSASESASGDHNGPWTVEIHDSFGKISMKSTITVTGE